MTDQQLKTVKKAQGTKVHSAWLGLSNNDLTFDKRLSVVDIFVQAKPDNTHEKVDPGKLWLLLATNGIHIHPMLRIQYNKQLTCIWCGGLITRVVVDETNFEDRCTTCGFRYAEG